MWTSVLPGLNQNILVYNYGIIGSSVLYSDESFRDWSSILDFALENDILKVVGFDQTSNIHLLAAYGGSFRICTTFSRL